MPHGPHRQAFLKKSDVIAMLRGRAEGTANPPEKLPESTSKPPEKPANLKFVPSPSYTISTKKRKLDTSNQSSSIGTVAPAAITQEAIMTCVHGQADPSHDTGDEGRVGDEHQDSHPEEDKLAKDDEADAALHHEEEDSFWNDLISPQPEKKEQAEDDDADLLPVKPITVNELRRARKRFGWEEAERLLLIRQELERVPGNNDKEKEWKQACLEELERTERRVEAEHAVAEARRLGE